MYCIDFHDNMYECIDFHDESSNCIDFNDKKTKRIRFDDGRRRRVVVVVVGLKSYEDSGLPEDSC